MTKFLFCLLIACLSSTVLADTGFSTILHDPLTIIFILLNVSLTYYFTRVRFDRFAVVHGPEVLTTVGICGCFLGIALALLNFDAANVSSSVPHLLEGVKTAFWASVSGVMGSLVIRWKHHVQKLPIPAPEGAAKSSSLDDVVNALGALNQGLSGGQDGSLLSQLKLMRQDQHDQLTTLRSSFDEFAKQMAKAGTDALIQALKEVIADFNAKINEQFGENFKQLNAAVEKLVVWQQQYKDELDQMQRTQRSASESLSSSSQSLALMVQQCDGFTKTAESLGQLIDGLNKQYGEIVKAQETLAKLLGEMKDVAPQFASKLEQLTESLKAGVTKLQAEMSDSVKNFTSQNQAANSELKQVLIENVRKSNGEVNEQLQKSLETIRQSVVTLDKGLQEELSKSLETLGRQLASLSEKFVADYSPLTDRLREVVRIAQQPRG